MPIEFRCDNVEGFDAAVGTYRTCDQKIRAPEEYAGKRVKCPKCSQSVTVPSRATSTSTVGGSNGQDLDPRRGIMEVDFESESQVSSAAFGGDAVRCPKCGGQYSDEGICTLCNYAEPVKKAQRDRKQKKKVRSSGFQLWIMQLANDPKSSPLIGYCFFGAFNIFAFTAIAFGILSLNFLGILLAVMAAFFLFFIWAVFWKTRQLASDPEAGLGILAPLWKLLLICARQLKWEHYDGRLQARVVVDLRNQHVNDETLPGVAGFKEAQVMDLQGCNISDAGLRHLYGHKHLCCLVVTDTNVTTTAVANLQQSMPRIWVWC